MSLAGEFQSVPVSLGEAKNGDFIAEFLDKADAPQNLSSELHQFLASVFELSPYLKTCAFKEPAFLENLLRVGFEASCAELLEATIAHGLNSGTEAEVMTALRVSKRRAALLCGLADLGGWWAGERVTQALSDFAKASLSAAFDFVLLKQHEAGKLVLYDPEQPQVESGLVVLGMGKLGAGELNYSSDIDLILFFDSAAKIKLETDDPITLLSRMAKQLIKIMQERTADGYVFRMDLRLRPDPSSTPLVIPLEAALNYYEGQGQNWERAAMIKARPVAGDLKAGEGFLAELAPFVWRKYLDFAAINDIHSIKRQIHSHKGHGEITVLGHNVKLGRGGIREIEFFVQTQQLIAGGRNLALRTNRTITALQELLNLGWIEPKAASELSEAYWFLRNVEHRLQMVSDEQTHTLPEDEKDLARIARLCGLRTTKALSRQIVQRLECVSRHYGGLFESSTGLSTDEGSLVFTGDDFDPETIETLSRLGFKQPEATVKIVRNWHVAKLPALRATKAREMLTELVPALLSRFGKSENPDEAILLFDRFLSGLPAGIQLFSILQNNPALSNLIMKLLTSAPRLAQQISRQPHIFDAMIDPNFVQDKADYDDLFSRISLLIDRAPDYESALDVGRRFHAETSFLYGCQFFSGIITLDQLKQAFSILGDVLVTAMYACVCKEFGKRHGTVAGAQTCVLGMGRLGSRELTATSDLDLIFLYDFDEDEDMSDGEKPLQASLYFTRLMQRFIAAMSSPTSEGIIYNLDFRLRPSGNAGPLATHVDGFLKYQRNEAWVWEAQALSRARPVCGDEGLVERLLGEIPDILAGMAGRSDLKSEIFKMRQLIDKEKGTKNIWDIKTVAGGLIDIEFIAQYFALAGCVTNALRTGDAIEAVPDDNLPGQEKSELLKALSLYEGIMHLQRVCLGESSDVDNAPIGFHATLLELFDLPDMNACRAHLEETQRNVRSIFNKLLK